MKKFFFLFLILVFISGCSWGPKLEESSVNNVAGGYAYDFAGEGAKYKSIVPTMISSSRSYDESYQVNTPKYSTDAMINNYGNIKNKIIYDVSLSYEVEDFEATNNTLEAEIKKHNAYISYSNKETTDYELRAVYQVKVPADKYNSFLTALKGLGESKIENISSSDISKTYFDLETRLSSKMEIKKRLENLLDQKGKDLTSVLQVEKELARVIEEIDSIKGELRYYDNKTDYSTFNITVFKKLKNIASSPSDFDNLLRPFKLFFKNILISVGVIVSLIAWLLPWIIIFAGLFWVSRKIWKRFHR